MFGASSVLARGKAAVLGSETEQRIAVLLYDDAVQVISSFELNQLASLTYHEAQVATASSVDMTEVILNHLEEIQKNYVNYSVLTVQKSLVVTKHILLFGAEKVLNYIRQQLGRYVEKLTEYNTVLLAQEQAGAWLLKLKGGGVDKGGPVRELAVSIHNLLQNHEQLRLERNTSASGTSLVPVGSRNQVAFCTDEVRLHHLRQELQEQQRARQKSNLKAADNGFGGGYNAVNGKQVVGAAHGIEEMLRQQQIHDNKFSDDNSGTAKQQKQQQNANAFSEYQAPTNLLFATPQTASTQQQNAMLQSSTPAAAPPPEADLLDFGASETPPQQHDLLGVTTTTSLGAAPPQPQQQDLLFGLGSSDTTTNVSAVATTATHDPFQPTTAAATTAASTTTLDLTMTTSVSAGPSLLDTNSNNMATTTTTVASMNNSIMQQQQAQQPEQNKNKFSVMSTNTDRFSALDALASSGGRATAAASNKPPSSSLDGLASLSLGNLTTTSSTAGTAPTLQQPSFTTATTTTAPSINLSSIQVSNAPPHHHADNDDDDLAFAMGGAVGSGLVPLGSAPAAPPPPPPPPSA